MTAFRLEGLTAPDDEKSGIVRLADPNPVRFNQGELHDLWKEALQNLQANSVAPGGKAQSGHRRMPIGPYRLVVIPSVRGRAAGQVAIQGMQNKQLELSTPASAPRGRRGSPLSPPGSTRMAASPSPTSISKIPSATSSGTPPAHELKFGDANELNNEMAGRHFEPIDNIDHALSRWFKPKNPG